MGKDGNLLSKCIQLMMQSFPTAADNGQSMEPEKEAEKKI
jgi:hypothetical protein